jgi:hypothetical protein
VAPGILAAQSNDICHRGYLRPAGLREEAGAVIGARDITYS